MKLRANFTESQSQSTPKQLSSSASSKMFVEQCQFQQSQVCVGRVKIQRGSLSRQLKNYQWRNSTEFGIVRVRRWQIINSNAEQAQLQIYYQSIGTVVQQLQQVPLFKVMYLLKEALIAYQRIFNRFGPCRITQQMIGINQFYKCRVWVNHDFASNTYRPLTFNERESILQICRILQEKTVKNKNSIGFYCGLYKCSSFSDFVCFVDHYAKDNKIAIPSCFKHQQTSTLKMQPKEESHKFHPNLTMSRSPKFINNMRDTLPSVFNRRLLLQGKKQGQVDNKGSNKKDYHPQLCLKTSGQTKADIYCSSTIADSKCKESYFLQAHHFANKQNNQPNMQKSQLLQFRPKGEKKPRLTHKLTNKQMFSCFTPQPRSYQHLASSDKWDDNIFYQPMTTIVQLKDPPKRQDRDALQEQEILANELQNLFEKNHWQQKIGGLFNEQQQEMKKSFNQGDQPGWKEQNMEELTLLKHLGKMIFESSCLREGTQ